MNRIFKYYKNCKGITLVLMALMLAVLLMLASLAIDIAYMYYVKNQLQVAADGAALAGAAKLDGTISIEQLAARREAWKFACKNRAADYPVYISKKLDDKNPNCDATANTLSASDLNGSNNYDKGDIVVGYWDSNDCQTDIPDGQIANCVKVVASRTGETGDGMSGMPRVGLFIGQIFSLIGADWSAMSARASAIAAFRSPAYGPLPICINTCANLPQTPLTGTPPGILITLQTPACPQPNPEAFAWTDFVEIGGSPKKEVIYDLLGVEKQGNKWILKQPKPPPNECCTNKCLRTKQGIGDVLPAITAIIQPEPEGRGKTYPIKGYNISGWRTFIPVFEYCMACDPCTTPGCVAPDPCSSPGTSPCPGDQPGGYKWVQSVEVIVTGVVETGPNAGVYIVGLDENAAAGKSKISCISCADPSIQQSAGVHLVK